MVPEMAPGMTPEMVLEVFLDTEQRKEGPTLTVRFSKKEDSLSRQPHRMMVSYISIYSARVVL